MSSEAESVRRPPPRGWPPVFVETGADRDAALVLAWLRGIPPSRLHELAWREGPASACLASVRAGARVSAADRLAARRLDVDAARAAVAACGARAIFPGDQEYGPELEDLPDPPVALFARGHPLHSSSVRVAIVGARRCSRLGQDVARRIAEHVAGAGVCVVSGAARGIDSAAHEGALEAEGPSVAVLGGGIDVAYPRVSERLIRRLADVGTVLSEYAPGVPPEAFRFPARNRIIASLSRAVLVVEGARGSGSLITVDHAASLGRTILAVPGPVTSPLTEGPHALIRDGAGLVCNGEDVLHELGLPAGGALGGAVGVEGIERRVIEAVLGPSLPEAVARQAGIPLPEAVATLLRLEIRGLVRSVGGRVERTTAGASIA